MSKTINRDDLFEERRGRLVGRDHHEAAAKSRAKHLLDMPAGGRRASRPGLSAGGTAGAGYRTGQAPSQQSVLKVIAWTKSHRAAPAQARYISRAGEERAEKQIPVEDEQGQQHSGRDAVDKVIESWNLTKDSENQTPAARALEKAASDLRQRGQRAEADEKARELRDLPQKDRLNKRQAVHLIFSVPAAAGGTPARLQAATREALQESFGAAGHKYVFAVHTDHSARPHVHIIAKAQSEPAVTGRRAQKSLRLGPTELHALRVLFTEKAREHGIDVTATRRIDRAPLREQITKARAPLRQNLSKGKIHTQEQSKQGGIFAAKAPSWYAAHGAAYESQRLAQFSGEKPAAAGEKKRAGIFSRFFRQEEPAALASGLPRMGQDAPAGFSAPAAQALKRLDQHFGQTYGHGAEKARESFLQMYREAPKLAVWSANQHPQAFGAVIEGGPPRRLTARGLNGLLRQGQNSPSISPAAITPVAPESAASIRLAAEQARARAEHQRNLPAMEKQLLTAARQIERAAGAEGAAAAAKIRQLAGAALTPADKSSIMEIERNRLVNRDKTQRGRDRGRDIE